MAKCAAKQKAAKQPKASPAVKPAGPTSAKDHSLLLMRRFPSGAASRAAPATSPSGTDQGRTGTAPGHTSAFQPEFSQTPVHGCSCPGPRPKLKVNAPGDRFEREADRAADLAVRAARANAATGSVPVGGATAANAPRSAITPSTTGGIVLSKAKSTGGERTVTPCTAGKIHALRDGGERLPTATRGFFESQYGRDFSGVRIHRDGRAATAAESVGARAFTLGNDIAFNRGEYAPDTPSGQWLLAHELAHVAQGGEAHVLRRAEVEDRPTICSGLTDIESDINTFVNGEIAAARASPGIAPVLPFLAEVRDRTGGTGPVGPVEHFIEGLPASKRFLPGRGLAGTRFSSLPAASGLAIPGLRSISSFLPDINIYDAHGRSFPFMGDIHVVGATALIHGICVGGDKLGHFFQQGFQYFAIERTSSRADAESFGRATEIAQAGLGATGVFSNADLAANLAGLQLWQDLEADPGGYTFDIANYIAADWNEYNNPNFYEPTVAREIWATQLTGTWGGFFGLGPATQGIQVDLSATNSGTVTGTFVYIPIPAIMPVFGTINGTITYNTTAVSGTIPSRVLHGGAGAHSASPVSGITIEFDWVSGGNSGKGEWRSAGETKLVGTYGFGTSRVDGGVFEIEKT